VARYLVFDQLNRANQAANAINTRLRQAFVNLGYTVDASGVVPRRVSDGVDQPDAARTTGWAEPVQRATDGKWVLPHPENHPLRDVVVDQQTGQKWADYLSAGATNFVIEEWQPAWFPSSRPAP
jgi:hypothetical protein